MNFYHLLEVALPKVELELHRSFIEGTNLDIRCSTVLTTALISYSWHPFSNTVLPPRTQRSLSAAHLYRCRGRIYISGQGINAQYSGPSGDAVAYADWLRSRDGFESLRLLSSLHASTVLSPHLRACNLAGRRRLLKYAARFEHLSFSRSAQYRSVQRQRLVFQLLLCFVESRTKTSEPDSVHHVWLKVSHLGG